MELRLHASVKRRTDDFSGHGMVRGTEWYVMRNQRIAEVRAYYHYDEAKDCQLNGFPYPLRGYLEK